MYAITLRLPILQLKRNLHLRVKVTIVVIEYTR